ncbi:unnamed protein product [Triticum turgidum subsp. durum]|uniref:Uncharacterized protein n=1 Tax=Triticum turgidum subsp. durum TaxID=4567 RepID=A0A9R1A6I2_TRITD|nr:unnamed protein product [Triticum turgidum subsp. durum]
MSGLIIILSSAAMITHQARALTGQTTKLHACCTIEPVPDDEIDPGSNQNSMLEEYPEDESDRETGDEDMLENTKFLQPHTHVISFEKRQALVTYLENNKAGITVFRFTLDLPYLHTIFMLEWTLFLWLLGKTVGFS